MDDKSIVCSFENLYKAYRKAKRGKGFNGSCARFQIMSLEGVHTLKEQLENKTYRMAPGELGIERYGRYMDDFYLIHHNKEYLKWCLECIRELVGSLGLSLNGKTQIVPFKCGMGFLGFHHYVTSDGKYIRKLKGENKRRIRKKVTRWVKAVKSGKMPLKKFQEKYGAWKNHALHGNCIKLCHSMDLYVEELMKCK